MDSTPAEPTDMDDYLFDLRGYLVLEDAIADDEVAALNDAVDDVLPLEPGDWHGGVQRRESTGVIGDSIQLQQIYELPPFETLIDHPSWIGYIDRYLANAGFDRSHGPTYIDENFFQISPQGEGTDIHSGGHTGVKHLEYAYEDGRWACGQLNVLLALNDIGPGDGATMAVPGSHKQRIEPPFYDDARGNTLEDVPDAEEIHLDAGDALLFVDGIMHGSATRTNPGERRFAVFRYSPSWTVSRRGYEPTTALLDRLTEDQAALVKTWGIVEPRSPPEG